MCCGQEELASQRVYQVFHGMDDSKSHQSKFHTRCFQYNPLPADQLAQCKPWMGFTYSCRYQ